MKKTLALLLAVAFAVPAFAGNIFSNVETYGEIETVGLTTSANADVKTVANRVLFGLGMDLVEDVRSNITFAYTNIWDSDLGDDVNTYLNRIVVAEANVVISNIFGAIETKIGRQFYGNEDSAVMYWGPRHGNYANITMPESMDGALATWSNDSMAVSAFYGQIADVSGIYGDDERLTGLTFDYAFTNNLTAGVYWYDYNNYIFLDHLGIWGGKIAYQNEGAKLGVEYAKNYKGHVFGHNNEGWMLKADAAMNLDMEAIALTPRVAYYHAEKDFVATGNYAPGIILGNVNGPLDDGLNWRVLNAGIDFGFKALEKVTFAFDYLAAEQDRHWVANEFDLKAIYQHNDYVSFTLGGAIATKFGANSPIVYDKDLYAGQLGMLIKF